MRIIRVFPRRTSYTPSDDYSFFDEPGLFVPEFDEVHISVVFTWDIERGKQLQHAWQSITDKPVLIGGPAFGSPCDDFIPGRYVKPGVTFTSRGCCNNCGFCFVPKREGALKELPIVSGNTIQDNNFLACSQEHRANAYDMLRTQKAICFKGGLEAARLTDWDIKRMRGLRIKELWLAADSPARLPIAIDAIKRLAAAGYSSHHIRCYVLGGSNMDEENARCKAVYDAGAMPFLQLYQPEQPKKYPVAWRRFQTAWTRPAAIESHKGDIDLVLQNVQIDDF